MSNFDGLRLTHAYISSGDMTDLVAAAVVCSNRNESGPCNLCKHCQKAIRKIHPDIISLNKSPELRYFAVDQIRALKRDVIIVPNEAEQKVYIINDAHLMNDNAQNAFLQVLEEPPNHVVFILNTEYPVRLLPTILSRCVNLRGVQVNAQLQSSSKPLAFNEDSSNINDDFDSDELISDFFSAIDKGNSAISEFMFTLEKLSKEQFSDFITSARLEATRLLRSSKAVNASTNNYRIALADELLVKAYNFLDQNVNTGHISGFICANLIQDPHLR